MPVEIRELVVEARIIGEGGSSAEAKARDAALRAQIKAEVLEECKRLIRREFQREKVAQQ